MINAIIIKVNGDLELKKVDLNEVLEDYELYAPISKYNISVGVIPIDDLEDNQINIIGSNIYNSIIRGECIIISDVDEEIPIYYKELLYKYKYIH